MINFKSLVNENDIPLFVPDGIDDWSDRFEKARELHHWVNKANWEKYNTETKHSRWRQADIPELAWADRHEGDVFSWDRDYFKMDRNDPEIVVRDKVYLPQYYLEPEKYEIIKDNEILLYWYNFCQWAMPMANEYAGVFESDDNGDTVLGQVEEDDVLGLPCLIKIAQDEYTDKKTGEPKQAWKVFNVYPWASGEKIDVDEIKSDVPF